MFHLAKVIYFLLLQKKKNFFFVNDVIYITKPTETAMNIPKEDQTGWICTLTLFTLHANLDFVLNSKVEVQFENMSQISRKSGSRSDYIFFTV